MSEPEQGTGRARGGRHAWWSERFLALVEGMSLPDPLRAGRALARGEAVLSVRRSGNLVVAMVRDQGEDLHKARLAVRTFGDTDWGRVERALAAEALYAAALLAGALPDGVEQVFAGLGLALFPTRADDLAMDCTCADWQRPCAHLVAGCHRLVESIDQDPFTLLALRGRERDAVLTQVRRRRPPSAFQAGRTALYAWPGEPRRQGTAVAREPGPGDAGPLPASAAAFWSSPRPGNADGATAAARGAAPARPDVLLDLCGPLSVEEQVDLREALRPAYQAFTTRG